MVLISSDGESGESGMEANAEESQKGSKGRDMETAVGWWVRAQYPPGKNKLEGRINMDDGSAMHTIAQDCLNVNQRGK